MLYVLLLLLMYCLHLPPQISNIRMIEYRLIKTKRFNYIHHSHTINKYLKIISNSTNAFSQT